MEYELQDCIGIKLRRMSRKIDGLYRTRLKGFDITENQMSILFVLSKSGSIEQGRLGNYLLLEKSSISRTIRLLEGKKLVVRTKEYRPEVELTKLGTKKVSELLPVWDKIMQDIVDLIGMDGLNSLKDLEHKLL